MEYFSCMTRSPRLNIFLPWLSSWVNIYWSNNLNIKSHKVIQSNRKENTVISEAFQKVFVGSEFWVLLILIINLGCYKSFPP